MSCYAGTASISMSGTFGIEKPRWIETRFQRLVVLGIIGFLGRCPRLTMNAAPLALRRFFLFADPKAFRGAIDESGPLTPHQHRFWKHGSYAA